MKRINNSYKLIEFLSGGGTSADTVFNVAPSPLLELHVYTFYLKFTNLTTQADLLSPPVVALLNSFLAI